MGYVANHIEPSKDNMKYLVFISAGQQFNHKNPESYLADQPDSFSGAYEKD